MTTHVNHYYPGFSEFTGIISFLHFHWLWLWVESFSGSTINHVCAINTLDGCTAVHRAIQCSDQKTGLLILGLLLTTDTAETAVINVQNVDGLTPLHLACKLDHKQVVKKLLVSSICEIITFTFYSEENLNCIRTQKLFVDMWEGHILEIHCTNIQRKRLIK